MRVAFGILLLGFLSTTVVQAATPITVSDGDTLRRAVASAKPGHVINLLPGTYEIGRVATAAAGTEAAPIVVRADSLGDSRITVNAIEGFVIQHPYWIFENLDIAGKADWIEHAFHIVGDASNTTLRHNRMVRFTAAVKGNGLPKPVGKASFPNDVIIEGNFIYNPNVVQVRASVTPVDVVGGARWIVRDNFIADFGKAGAALGANDISYGAFLKGNSSAGIFEGNLVVCEWRHTGGIRIGLSFGGGGTGTSLCENQDCSTEHRDGIIRNNIIMHCRNDVAIYLNRSRNTKVFHNTIYNSYGVDVRFPTSTAQFYNNVISGGIQERDGGVITNESNNVITGFAMANAIPGLTRYINRRLEGQDAKYPSIISKGMVESTQGIVRATMEYLGDSWLGRDKSAYHDWFAGPDYGDFALRDGSKLLRQGARLLDATKDFCGTERGKSRTDIGAIEYSSARCDVARRLLQLQQLMARRPD